MIQSTFIAFAFFLFIYIIYLTTSLVWLRYIILLEQKFFNKTSRTATAISNP